MSSCSPLLIRLMGINAIIWITKTNYSEAADVASQPAALESLALFLQVSGRHNNDNNKRNDARSDKGVISGVCEEEGVNNLHEKTCQNTAVTQCHNEDEKNGGKRN